MSVASPTLLENYLPNRKRWSRADCEFLERVGLLTERYELLDGEIIEKVGQNRPHIIGVTRAMLWLAGVYGNDRVQCQADVEVAVSDREFNFPQPDVAALSRPDYTFTTAPEGPDVLLAIEVSDSTLRDDLRTKATLYARAGVPEYWVLDVAGRQLFVHRLPAEGRYTEVTAFGPEATIAPETAPDHPVRIADLLPPEPISD